MKTTLASLILLAVVALNTFAQDISQGGVPEGAKARLDIGGGRIFDVKYSPDGTRLAAGCSSGVWLFDLETGDAATLMRNGNSSSAFRVAFRPDGRTIAAAVDDSICLWDAVTREKKHSLFPKLRNAARVAFSLDGRTIAGGGDEIVHLWDVETGQRKYTVRGVQLAYVTSIAFSSDGRTLASGHTSPLATHSVSDGKIHFWDTETGKRKNSTNTAIRKPTSLAYSPDGQTLASGHVDAWPGFGSWGWVTLRDAETLEFKRQLGTHPNGKGLDYGVRSVAFSPDGSTLAVGRAVDEWFGFARDTLRLWDPVTGAHLRTLEGHTDDVNSVAFSPDGSTLASGSSDGTVLLWEIIPSSDPVEDKHPEVAEPPQVKPDVNEDGVVGVQDLVLVAARLGIAAENREDVNGDGTVNMLDLVLVAGVADDSTDALPAFSNGAMMLRTTKVREWLEEARRLDLADVTLRTGIEYLQNLLEALTPERTTLLPNFPNPFNPETWIPYQLAHDSHVRISIYSSKGILVRHLDLGLQAEGFYTDKLYAAYWDGRNESGELLASGVYVYVFRAGSYRASRRMAIVR
ncbi:MAG: dockerin type I domain-containing protein [Candidatus Poribacteria bacterium]|nr:dockerin type I domain-containing protein [Candidatus Poribacteria bacterium]